MLRNQYVLRQPATDKPLASQSWLFAGTAAFFPNQSNQLGSVPLAALGYGDIVPQLVVLGA
jgi:hypothetical protein